jgi:hypothetical protein
MLPLQPRRHPSSHATPSHPHPIKPPLAASPDPELLSRDATTPTNHPPTGGNPFPTPSLHAIWLGHRAAATGFPTTAPGGYLPAKDLPTLEGDPPEGDPPEGDPLEEDLPAEDLPEGDPPAEDLHHRTEDMGVAEAEAVADHHPHHRQGFLPRHTLPTTPSPLYPETASKSPTAGSPISSRAKERPSTYTKTTPSTFQRPPSPASTNGTPTSCSESSRGSGRNIETASTRLSTPTTLPTRHEPESAR